MREIDVAESDAPGRAEARPWLLQYWDPCNCCTQVAHGGRLPDSYDFWRKQVPMLRAMSFDETIANNMVILGGPETVAEAILHLADQVDLMGLGLIFKLGAMPYDMVERSMRAFGDAVMPRIGRVLDGHVSLGRAA